MRREKRICVLGGMPWKADMMPWKANTLTMEGKYVYKEGQYVPYEADVCTVKGNYVQ